MDDNLVIASPEELRVQSPFSDLFPVQAVTRDIIAASMRRDGYDASKPINVWRKHNLVVDGHTRRLAAIEAGVEVAVYFHDFADEQAALEYAIASQRCRRNLTEVEIAKCILALDKVKAKGGDRGNQHTGGKATSVALPEGVSKTAAVTAALVGTNRGKVEQTRRLEREAPDLLQEVIEGKRMVNGAHNELLTRKGKTPYDRPQARFKRSRSPAVHPSLYAPVVTSPAAVAAPIAVDPDWTPAPPNRALRELLANPFNFDLDARIYEWMGPRVLALIAELREHVGPISGAWRGPLHQAIHDFADLTPPYEWIVCPRCQGEGVTDKGTCTLCNASGYRIPKS